MKKNRRKLIAIISMLTLVLSMFAACGTKEAAIPPEPSNELPAQCSPRSVINTDETVNSKHETDGMLNLAGKPFDYEAGEIFEDFGFGFVLTDFMEELQTSNALTSMVSPNNGFLLAYVTEKGLESIESGTHEDGGRVTIMGIFRITEGAEENARAEEIMASSFSNTEIIASVGKDTFYFAYNTDFTDFELTDADIENLDDLLAEKDDFTENLCVFSVKEKADANMNDFDATTLNGESFTQLDFAEYELTMVNIWTTWCNPCVAEMPDLQKLYEKLPSNVNLISICEDSASESELAKEIVKETGVQYTTLIPDEKLNDSIVDSINAFPTTVFVDKEGNIVGDPSLGVPKGDDVSEAYLEIIHEYLGMAGEK